MAMIKKSTIKKEYRKIEKILKNHRELDENDAFLLYGARQALGWILNDNCAKATACITKPTPKAVKNGGDEK